MALNVEGKFFNCLNRKRTLKYFLMQNLADIFNNSRFEKLNMFTYFLIE